MPPPKFQDSDLRRPIAAGFPGASDLRALSWAHVRVRGAAERGCHIPAWLGFLLCKSCFQVIRDIDLCGVVWQLPAAFQTRICAHDRDYKACTASKAAIGRWPCSAEVACAQGPGIGPAHPPATECQCRQCRPGHRDTVTAPLRRTRRRRRMGPVPSRLQVRACWQVGDTRRSRAQCTPLATFPLRPFGTTLLYHTGITRISSSVLRLSVSG